MASSLAPPLAPPPPPAPPPLFITDTKRISDSSVISGAIINAVFGGLMFLGFLIAQTLNKKLYRFRTISESVSLRPPDFPTGGQNWSKYYLWAVYTWRATDLDILISCGLDAFFMTKIPVIGMQLFVPWAFFSLTVLLPVHYHGGYLKELEGTPTSSASYMSSSNLAWLTMANLKPKTRLLWIHVVFVFGYSTYGLVVLYYHFLQIARLRLRYLSRGDDLSFFAEILSDKITVTQKRLAQAQATGQPPLAPRVVEARKRALAALERRLDHLTRVMQGVQQRIAQLEHLRATARGPRLHLLDEGPHAFGSSEDDPESTGGKPGTGPANRELYDAGKAKNINHMHHMVAIDGNSFGGAAPPGTTQALGRHGGTLLPPVAAVGDASVRQRAPVAEARERSRSPSDMTDEEEEEKQEGGEEQWPGGSERLHGPWQQPAVWRRPGALGTLDTSLRRLLDVPLLLGAAWERRPASLPWWQHRQRPMPPPTVAGGTGGVQTANDGLRLVPGSRVGGGGTVPGQALGEGVEERTGGGGGQSGLQLRPSIVDAGRDVQMLEASAGALAAAARAGGAEGGAGGRAGSSGVGGSQDGRWSVGAGPADPSLQDPILGGAVDPILGVAAGGEGEAAAVEAAAVAGAGKLVGSKVDILKQTMPVMFLERPSARYQSSILVPVLTPPEPTDPLLLTTALQVPSAPPAAAAAGVSGGPASVAAPGAAVAAGCEGGGGGFAHRGRAHVGALDDLPWGDPLRTGRPHLHAVHAERYALLVTDVPILPFVPPVYGNPDNDPKVKMAKERERRRQERLAKGKQLLSRCCDDGSDGDKPPEWAGASGNGKSALRALLSRGSKRDVLDQDRQLGDALGRQQVEVRRLGANASVLWRWCVAARSFLFPSYGTVAEMLHDFQENAGKQSKADQNVERALTAAAAADSCNQPRRHANKLLDDEDDASSDSRPSRGHDIEMHNLPQGAGAAPPMTAVLAGVASTPPMTGARGKSTSRLMSASPRASDFNVPRAGSGAAKPLGTRTLNPGLVTLGDAGGGDASVGSTAASSMRRRRTLTAQQQQRQQRQQWPSSLVASELDTVPSGRGFSALTTPSQASYTVQVNPLGASPATAAVGLPPRSRRISNATARDDPASLHEVSSAAAAAPLPALATRGAEMALPGAASPLSADAASSPAAAPAGLEDAPAAADGGGGAADVRERHRLLHSSVAVEAMRLLVARSRGWELWARAREAVLSGRVAELPRLPSYDPVSAMFSMLFPNDFERAMPILNYHRVHYMLRQWNFNMIALDTALTIRERLHKEAKQLAYIGGCLRVVNSVEHLTDIVYKLQCDIVKERQKAINAEDGGTGCYIVLFKSQAAASLAAGHKTALSENKSTFLVHPAPSPNNINWQVLSVPWDSRRKRWFAMVIPKVLLILLPITAFSSMFTQLDFIFCPASIYAPPPPAGFFGPPAPPTPDVWSWSWYCSQTTFIARLLKALVIGWAPSWILALYTSMVLPNAFHGLCQKSANNLSLTTLDMDVCNLYWWFNVMNTFLCGLLGGSFAQQIHSVLMGQGLRGTFQLIGSALPNASNFYINYMCHKTLFGWANKLVIPNGGVVLYCFRKILRWYRVFSVREKAFVLYTTRSPRYGPEIGNLMMPFVVCSAFALVSPIVPAVAVFFFAFGWGVWRYLLLFLNVRKYEGGGHYIHFVFERLLACLAILVFFTAAVIATKEAWAQFYVVVFTMPFFIFYMGWYARQRFGPMLSGQLPLEVAAAAPRVEEFNSDIYNHPALHPQALGWHPDLHLVWSGIGIWGQL